MTTENMDCKNTVFWPWYNLGMIENAVTRKFFGELLKMFAPSKRLSTIDWTRQYRFISEKETTFGVGRFDPGLMPHMLYVYECLDNPNIPEVAAMKSARVGWTEVLNNFRAKTIDSNPQNMLLGFPTKEASRSFAKGKWAALIESCPRLRERVNVGIPKNRESLFDFSFPGGQLRLVTLGSISNQKSDNISYIEIEEPDDAKDDVNGQGDTWENLRERQKTVPITMRKFIAGGTPTISEFSRVEKLMLQSNGMVFKAQCHHCSELIPLDGRAFTNIHYSVRSDGRIDDVYGRYDPHTAIFKCPECDEEWTFDQKNKNIHAGLSFGKMGWHATRENTDIIGFYFSELLSPFASSNFVELAKGKIRADEALLKGNEALLKSYTNNRMGMPYSSGVTAIDTEQMRKLRRSYKEGIVPVGGLVLTAGIDIQRNRLAIVVVAWGENGNSWLVKWTELFGDVLNPTDDVWYRLTDFCKQEFPTAYKKPMKLSAIAVDTGDGSTTELAYRWILGFSKHLPATFATKGVKDLTTHGGEIYTEPSRAFLQSTPNARRSLAETMGVVVYKVGAHRSIEEIYRRIGLLKTKQDDAMANDRFYFCETEYGGYEEQMTSVKKVIEGGKSAFRLIPGKHKEALDCSKLCLWCFYALGLRGYGRTHWEEIYNYYNK